MIMWDGLHRTSPLKTCHSSQAYSYSTLEAGRYLDIRKNPLKNAVLRLCPADIVRVRAHHTAFKQWFSMSSVVRKASYLTSPEASCLRLSFKHESIHERANESGHSSTQLKFKARLKSLRAEQTRDKPHINNYCPCRLENVECVQCAAVWGQSYSVYAVWVAKNRTQD